MISLGSGSIFFQDSYETQYEVEWETNNDLLDITTVISQPFVWGEENKGHIDNGKLFRWGIITVQRQIIKILNDGYEIVAEGASQICDYIQMNFPCEKKPEDNFRHHLDYAICDDTYFKMVEGPRFVDPDTNSNSIWGDVTDDGNLTSGETATGETTILKWINVWQ